MKYFPQITCLSVIHIDSKARLDDLQKGLLTTLIECGFFDLRLIVVQECQQYKQICDMLAARELHYESGPNNGKWYYWQQEIYECHTPFLLEIDFDILAKPIHVENLLKALVCLHILTGKKGAMCSYVWSPSRGTDLFDGERIFQNSQFKLYKSTSLPGCFRMSNVELCKRIPRVPLKCGYGTDPVFSAALQKAGLVGGWIVNHNVRTNIIHYQSKSPTRRYEQIKDNHKRFLEAWPKK